jgi:hypothetical protein
MKRHYAQLCLHYAESSSLHGHERWMAVSTRKLWILCRQQTSLRCAAGHHSFFRVFCTFLSESVHVFLCISIQYIIFTLSCYVCVRCLTMGGSGVLTRDLGKSLSCQRRAAAAPRSVCQPECFQMIVFSNFVGGSRAPHTTVAWVSHHTGYNIDNHLETKIIGERETFEGDKPKHLQGWGGEENFPTFRGPLLRWDGKRRSNFEANTAILAGNIWLNMEQYFATAQSRWNLVVTPNT